MGHEASQGGLKLIHITTEIVAAFLAHQEVKPGEVQALIVGVHEAVCGLAAPRERRGAAPLRQRPAIQIRQSVTADYIVCLEDGARLKSLKRHLMRNHGMTVDVYRQKWGLPLDYPVIAATYSSERSALAKRLGLGRREG